MAAFLDDIGRREVDDDAPGRQRQADRGQGGADPFPRLRHRLVRQADDDERGQPAHHLDLHLDVENVDTVERDGVDARNHGGSITNSSATYN